MQSTIEVLEWARENVAIVEITCDMVCADPGEVILPVLEPAERELESLLVSCLECRSGGLDPKTPMRDRAWLWRGLGGMCDVVAAAPTSGSQGG